jgi:polyisoprenoid-binding protein YceI
MFARLLALLAALSLVVSAARADVSLGDAAGRYTVRNGDSAIRFSIAKLGGGGLSGAFGRFTGTIRIDGADVGRSSVEITIFPESVGTGQERIDAFLRSDAVFDSANAPKIVFRSTSVKRTGDTTAVITGRLTARGRSSPETFTVRLDSLKRGAVALHVTGKVLRSRYGMDVGTPIYSNVVDFDMTLTGRRG